MFTTNGAIGEERKAFYKRSADIVAEKECIFISIASNLIRKNICSYTERLFDHNKMSTATQNRRCAKNKNAEEV